LPPNIVLPRWRMKQIQVGVTKYLGNPRTCDCKCVNMRTHAVNPNDSRDLNTRNFGCAAYGEYGSKLEYCNSKNSNCQRMFPNGLNNKCCSEAARTRPSSSQPIGFLSKLGAEGKGAHVLATFTGRFKTAKWERMLMDLSTKPRFYPDSEGKYNLAMASYPFTKLFTTNNRLFTLEVLDTAETQTNARSGCHGPAAGLKLDEVRVWQSARCGGNNKLQRVPLAVLKWPPSAKSKIDFLCQPYANEEETLIASSPMVLVNKQYGMSSLLLNMKNRLYTWSITEQLKTKCQCGQCGQSEAKQLDSQGVVTSFIGLLSQDLQSTAATTVAAVSDESIFVFSSYNTLQSVDLSLAVPCGRLMQFLQPQFKSWDGIAPGSTRTETHETKLRSVAGVGAATWICETNKQVKLFKGANLVKNTACCNLKGHTGDKHCCVEKHSSPDAKDTLTATDAELALELGAM